MYFVFLTNEENRKYLFAHNKEQLIKKLNNGWLKDYTILTNTIDLAASDYYPKIAVIIKGDLVVPEGDEVEKTIVKIKTYTIE